MDTVCVFCGSSDETGGAYADAATAFADVLADRGIRLAYGGGDGGVMGKLADAVLAAGGDVIGVIPESIEERETPHQGLTTLETVDSKADRKARLHDLADGFVAMPGGIGTQEELFEVLGRAKHGFHGKPCGVLNVAGYYDHLVAFLDHAESAGFLSSEQRSLVLVEADPAALLDACREYTSPVLDDSAMTRD